jgi:hypothetical protein
MTCPRPTSGGRHSNASPEANLGRETQSRLARTQSCLARCQPWMGDAIMIRPRPTSGGRRSHGSPGHSHVSPDANLGWETIMIRPRPTPSGRRSRLVRGQPPAMGRRRSHNSPEANPGREAQSRFARGQPRAGPTPAERRSHGSPEANLGRGRSHDSPEVNLGRETEREMCPWAISKYFGDLVSNTSA